MLVEDTSGGAVGGWKTSESPCDLQEVIASSTRHLEEADALPPTASRGGVTEQGKSKAASKKSSGGLPTLKASGSSKKSAAGKGGAGDTSSTKASSTKKGTAKSASAKKKKSRPTSGASSRATSKSRSTKGKGKKKGGRGSSTGSRKGKKSRSSTSAKSKASGPSGAAFEAVVEQEGEARRALIAEEEFELEGFSPVYNVLVMEMVRSQVEQLNLRQQTLNEMFSVLRNQGIAISEEDGMNTIMEKMSSKLRDADAQELRALREENVRLQERLEDKTTQLEKKSADVEVMRNNHARKAARNELEHESLRAEVHAALQRSTLDVDHMKKELGHRIDLACASFRTPKYETHMRAVQELVASLQEEIQQHHDRLSRLVLSIGAKDAFARDDSETMHTNFPTKFRDELRKLEKDQLLNLLDVLSFQDGVVDTVGKALYVLEEARHKTAVV